MKDRIYINEEELFEHANTLKNRSLFDLYGKDSIQTSEIKNKGGFGQLVERLHYGINNNNESRPDIENLNIEIKVSPLNLVYNGTKISPNQRTTLSMIKYDQIISETFETSHFLKKNKNILLNLFLLGPENGYEQKFLYIDLMRLSKNDLNIIKKDWEIIKEKVRSKNADSLSQSDTTYLCAATKGGGGQKLRPYMNGTAMAKKRSYSYKSAFISHFLKPYCLKRNDKNEYVLVKKTTEGIKLLDEESEYSVEEVVLKKFSNFIGKEDIEIARSFGYENKFIEGKEKARWHYNTSLILTTKRKKYLSKYIEEFSKSGLTVKTVRLDCNSKLKEQVSFKTQGYESILTKEWENSSLFQEISIKFLWVVYKQDSKGSFILDNCFFWKMPKSDIEFVREKWLELKCFFQNKDHRAQYFQNEDSFYFLKIKDQKGGNNKNLDDSMVTNLSHWFRKDYVEEVISNNQR